MQRCEWGSAEFAAGAVQACKDAGRGEKAQDYLNFFSPCKREVVGPNEPAPARCAPAGSPQVLPNYIHITNRNACRHGCV